VTAGSVTAEATPVSEDRHRLTVAGGLAALSLDAMSSVAYGPEAIVIVLAAAGGAGLGYTLPVTVAIALMLGILTLSYRDRCGHPDGSAQRLSRYRPMVDPDPRDRGRPGGLP
jgi:hypothetical protein